MAIQIYLMKKAVEGAVKYGPVVASAVQQKIAERKEKRDKEKLEDYVDESDWEEDSSDEKGDRTDQKKKKRKKKSTHQTTPESDPDRSDSPNKKNGKSITSRATEFITSEKGIKMGKELWKQKETVMGIAQKLTK